MAPSPEDWLDALGLSLPAVPEPAGSYVPAVRGGSLIFTAGQLPLLEGRLTHTGKVGAEVPVEEAQEAARLCALNALAAAASVAGSLNDVRRVVKITGYVASAPGFHGQPEVLNGASDLIGQIFGENGLHARSAIGVAELPFDTPVEIELVVEV